MDVRDVAQNVAQENNTIEKLILDEMKKNNKVTREEIAKKLGVSVKTIERKIKKMNEIEYYGSGHSGHWIVNED